jgi:hypothetical protein
MPQTAPRLLSAFVLSCALLATGCGASLIPNTDVEDTARNRDVVAFLESYRHAVEARDVRKLVSLASPRYLDHNGTTTGDDDIDLETLRTKIAALSSSVEDVRFEIRYRRVAFHDDHILVDVTYTGSFRIGEPDGGHHWSRRLSDQRFVLERAGDSFLIVSGM